MPLNKPIINLSLKESCTISTDSNWLRFYYSLFHSSRLFPFFDSDLYLFVLAEKLETSDNFEKIFTLNDKKQKLLDKTTIVIDLTMQQDRNSLEADKWSSITSKLTQQFPDSQINIYYSIYTADFCKSVLRQSNISLSNVQLISSKTFEPSNALIITSDGFIGNIAANHGMTSINIKTGTFHNIAATVPSDQLNIMESNIKCYPCSPIQSCDFFQCHLDIRNDEICNLIEHIYGVVTSEKPLLQFTHSKLKQSNLGLYFHQSIGQHYTPVLFYSHMYRVTSLFVFCDKEEIIDLPKLNFDIAQRIYSDSYAIEFFLKQSEELYQRTNFKDDDSINSMYNNFENNFEQLAQNFNYLLPLLTYFRVCKKSLFTKGCLNFDSMALLHETVTFFLVVMLDLIRNSTRPILEIKKQGAKNAVDNC